MQKSPHEIKSEATFCTSRATPDANRESIVRIGRMVDDFFYAHKSGLYSPECLDDPGYVKNIENYWVHVAVTDVLVGRHLGLSPDVMLAYMPEAARSTAILLAYEVLP